MKSQTTKHKNTVYGFKQVIEQYQYQTAINSPYTWLLGRMSLQVQ